MAIRESALMMEMKEMSQNSEMARHYGNLRFAMFTIFTAITGTLILLPLDKDRGALIAANPQRCLVALSGIILSIGFILAEWRMSWLVAFYQEKSFTESELSKPDCHDRWKIFILIIMVLPYLLSIFFWTLFLLGWITVNISSK